LGRWYCQHNSSPLLIGGTGADVTGTAETQYRNFNNDNTGSLAFLQFIGIEFGRVPRKSGTEQSLPQMCAAEGYYQHNKPSYANRNVKFDTSVGAGIFALTARLTAAKA